MNPRYPIYIVSKGRADSRLTSKALESINVPYYIIVERDEYDLYAKVIHPDKILTLPPQYHEQYEPCDEHGRTKPLGPGPARNFAWDISSLSGYQRHWVMDDNIASFNRLNRNLMVKVTNGAIFAAAEDFTDRYTNLAIAGFNYDFFAKAKEPLPAFVLNTRIYSCLLIDNALPYRWRGRYNEDTDLSLRALKDGYVTCQFNAFLQEKATTQTLKGGNTDAFYAHEGTGPKSEMLKALHPDVSEITWRFNRLHHHVDYKRFKRNKLNRVPHYEQYVRTGAVNDYGMRLTQIEKTT
jgi:hypothetical protein